MTLIELRAQYDARVREQKRANGSANGHIHADPQGASAVGTADPYAQLLITADYLDDIERVRIATENRIASIVRDKSVPAGLMMFWDDQLRELQRLEAGATRQLQRAMKAHPLNAWVESMVGVGHKQLARLLAATGDPASRETLGQFRQYCGHGDPERSSKRRGEQIEFNPHAKMRIYLIAAQCIRYDSSPYRAVYLAGREKYANSVHAQECKRCGPAGKPAQRGSDLSDGHKHARALRLVGKAILKDLYAEAKAVK